MELLKRFFKTSFLYLIGNVLTRAMSFIMVPLYTYYISPTDYGTYNYIVSIMAFFTTFCYFDLWSGILRFFFDYDDELGKNKCIFNGLIIFGVSSVIYAVCFSIFDSIMNVQYFVYIIISGILGNLLNVYTYLARGYKANRLFVVSGLISSALYFASNFVLLAYMHMDYSAIFISTSISSVCNIILIECNLNILMKIKLSFFDWHFLKCILFFSLPLAINSSACWLLGGYNQIAVVNTLSTYDNGIYSLAQKFSAAIYFFTSCFQLAWQEIAFDSAGHNQDKGGFYANAVSYYADAMLISTLLLCSIIYVIFPLFVNGAYYESLILIPFTILQAGISAISAFLGNIFSAIKRTKYLFITFLTAGIINVMLLQLLLPYYGIQIVNVILSFCMMIVVLLRIGMLKRYVRLSFNMTSIFVFFLIFAFVCYGYYLDNIGLIIFSLFFTIVVYGIINKSLIKICLNRITNS